MGIVARERDYELLPLKFQHRLYVCMKVMQVQYETHPRRDSHEVPHADKLSDGVRCTAELWLCYRKQAASDGDSPLLLCRCCRSGSAQTSHVIQVGVRLMLRMQRKTTLVARSTRNISLCSVQPTRWSNNTVHTTHRKHAGKLDGQIYQYNDKIRQGWRWEKVLSLPLTYLSNRNNKAAGSKCDGKRTDRFTSASV
jgi:hypothetical protein